MANQPAIATAFEAEVRRLGLDMQTCTSSKSCDYGVNATKTAATFLNGS